MHSTSRRARVATLIAAGIIGFGGVAAAAEGLDQSIDMEEVSIAIGEPDGSTSGEESTEETTEDETTEETAEDETTEETVEDETTEETAEDETTEESTGDEAVEIASTEE